MGNNIMKSKITLLDGFHFVGHTPSGHELHWDSGPADSATEGPAPMETALQAIAVCSAMDVVYILKKRRKVISSFELEVNGERSETYPKIFNNITITYSLSGDGITTKEAEKAVKLSQEKYCSLINMLKPAVQVGYSVEVV